MELSQRISSPRHPFSRPRLHAQETILLSVLGVHLCWLPWALGTMWWRAQVVSLVFSTIGMAIALMPRQYRQHESAPAFRLIMWPKLVRFAPFWIGLALIVYVTTQNFNPSWLYIANAKVWWVARLPEIKWLPTGVAAPFARFNGWRTVIIWSDAWLLISSIWVGVTRRESMRMLLGVIACNAVVMGVFLAWQRGTGRFGLPWAPAGWTNWDFTSSFVYRNHAGAFFGLGAFAAAALAIWSRDRAERMMQKSSPAGLFAGATLFLVGTIAFTLSRGALITAAIGIGLLSVWYVYWRRRAKLVSTDARLKLVAGLTVGLLIFGAFRLIDFSDIYGRMSSLAELGNRDTSVESRLLARHASMDLLRAHGWRGIGAGGFRYVFPGYAKNYPEIYRNGRVYWEHAHCDWLEIPIELGAIGDLIVLAGFFWLARHLVRTRCGLNPCTVPLLLGSGQTLIHAGFDFPFACPAVLCTWCTMLAVAAKCADLSVKQPQ